MKGSFFAGKFYAGIDFGYRTQKEMAACCVDSARNMFNIYIIKKQKRK